MARRPATPAILKGAILIAVWTPHCRSGRPSVLSARMQCRHSRLLMPSSKTRFAPRVVVLPVTRSPPIATVQFLHPLCHPPPPPSSPATAFLARLCSSLSSSASVAFLYFQNFSSALAVPIICSLMISLRGDFG